MDGFQEALNARIVQKLRNQDERIFNYDDSSGTAFAPDDEKSEWVSRSIEY